MVMKTFQRRPRKHWFADLKAEALACYVGRTSDQRLESVIRSRVRGVLLWLIFRTIRQRAQPHLRVNAVVEFRITGRRDGGVDRYRLALAGGRASEPRLAGQEPALTLELEPVAFLRLASGTASPQRLLIARKLKLHGDLMLALALPTALRLPTSRPRPSKR
jgi:SCP-2 sterol transfer family